MKPKFITCNYTNLYGTRLNGRLNRDQIYMYSLRAIAESGDLIVNYTCPYNREFVDPYLESHNITNIRSIDYDLVKDSPYHQRVDAIKDIEPFFYTDNSWQNRCVEIMWGKFIWLEENFNTLDADDYLFWIDGGLSHGGVLPRLFNTFHNNPDYYKEDKTDLLLEYACRHDRIFNKDFSRKLETYTGDKVLLITANHNQHGDALGFEFINTLREWPIGGLFGGKKKTMMPFIQRFKELADTVLNNKLLVKEEQLMAVVLNEHPEWFKTFMFETWYHPDWDVYNPQIRSFYNFFEEIVNVP